MVRLENEVLQSVLKPARYTGGEWNAVIKDHAAVDCTWALALPDVYEVGMSNLGLAILYEVLNRRKDIAAERVYAPWTDMEEDMRKNDLPLYGLESGDPITHFDFVGFSLGYEMAYTNVLNMLDLAHIPVRAEDRGEDYPIVVAGGYGMGSKEGFDMLFKLAKELHGEVGASRAAVDAGWVDHDRQIGQTGVTVHPKVYIACGISGQIQHIAGMQDAGIIISVNSDPDAPINKIADYVITGTVEEVVPKLIKYYKQNSK